jgi:hypothetical protein
LLGESVYTALVRMGVSKQPLTRGQHTYIVTTSVIIDDLLQVMHYRDDTRTSPSAAEILTVAVMPLLFRNQSQGRIAQSLPSGCGPLRRSVVNSQIFVLERANHLRDARSLRPNTSRGSRIQAFFRRLRIKHTLSGMHPIPLFTAILLSWPRRPARATAKPV